MAAVMTSWKEIARYLGKGVRTAQRWESEFGLPVRRNERSGSGTKSVVIAIPEELDAWIRTRYHLREDNELTRLRRENAELRERLQRYEREKGLPPWTQPPACEPFDTRTRKRDAGPS